MPPAFFVQANQLTVLNNDVSLVVNTPTRARPGEVLIAAVGFFISAGAPTLNAHPDWEVLGFEQQSSRRITLLRRVVAEDEPATHTFTLTGALSREPMAAIALFRGLNTSAPLVASASASSAGTNHTAPSVNTTSYSDLMICAYLVDANTDITPAGGTTQISEQGGGGTPCDLMLATYRLDAIGATGAKVATTGGVVNGVGASFLLAADALNGADKAIKFVPPGAIGLPAEGI